MIWWVVKDKPEGSPRPLEGNKGSLLVHLEAQNYVIFNTVRLGGWKITQMICEKFES
jgi:hypothetical protein